MSKFASVVASGILVFASVACAGSTEQLRRAPAERESVARADPFAGHDAPTSKRAFEVADFYACAVVGSPSLSPDGGAAVFSVRRYDLAAGESWSQLWRVELASGETSQLTSGRHNDTEPQFTPDGAGVVYLSNRSGSSQVWTLSTAGGEPRQLTDFAPGVGAALLSPDGTRLALTAEIFPECGLDLDCHAKQSKGLEGKLQVRVADELLYRHWTAWHQGKRTHIFLADAVSGAVLKDLTPGEFDAPAFSLGGRSVAWSPDSKELCYVANHDADAARSTNSDLWVVPVEGPIDANSARNLTAANAGWDGAPLYSPDGRWIAFISQETPGYESDLRRLAVFDRACGEVRYLTHRGNFDDWVEDLRWTPDGRSLVFQAEYEGRNPLFLLPLEGETKPVGVLEHGHIGGWELLATGEAIYTQRAIAHPSELFAAKMGELPRRLTHFNRGVEDEVDVRPAAELWLDGGEGRRIHTFVVTPHGFDPSKRYPLILNVHGGPQSQWTDAFRGDWQVYPGKGYIVAFCNPTGSTGYGQDFTDAIRGEWGGKPFQDLMKVCDQLERLPFVDAERMGVMGWSYGGYMAMWMQGHTQRFKANAAMMGLYDLRSFYGATEELWFPEHDLRGEPWSSSLYERWSPSKHVKNFRTPALVVTGELDYRVPYTQSLQYFTALKKRGVPARLVVFPGAGHWPAWHEMAFYYNAHLDFFHTYLGGEPAPWDVEAHARNLHLAPR
jgi:dipeptidyl aminopeptidase/acylaminoacyl peptidase